MKVYAVIDTTVAADSSLVVDTTYYEYEVWYLTKAQADYVREVMNAMSDLRLKLIP